MVDTGPLPAVEDRGRLDIRDRVVEKIIRAAAASESTVKRANGIGRLVADDLPRVSAAVQAGTVEATVTVAAQWPTPAATFAERIHATVVNLVREQTGLIVARCDVAVQYLSQSNDDVRRVL